MQWNLQNSDIPTTKEEVVDVVLQNRGISDEDEFLHPTHPVDLSLASVGLSASQIDTAVARIQVACQKKEPIIVFGDYDCDGVCASTVLWETLFEMGCKVMPFIPHRELHGYGLSKKALDEIFTAGKPAILISVDNGIVANDQWQRIKDEGVFGILTDHHQPTDTLPPADVIIHSTQLCGTTVAWMLVRALNPQKARETLDLCAIATIADQVPLLEANRSFATYGLEQLNHTQRVGLQLLMKIAGLEAGSITSGSVNFGIAPRINAMGRLEHALDALRALCTKRRDKAQELVGKLQDVNQTRQDLTFELIEAARSHKQEWEHEKLIFLADEAYHEGIIGLIAGRLTEEFFKPTVVLSKGEITSKASCRSIPGVHITNLLRELKDDLLEVGGHPMAAGFKIETGKLEIVKEKLQRLAREQIADEMLIPHIDVECELPYSLLDIEMAELLSRLEPFGASNRQPLFAIKHMKVVQAFCVGKENKHLKVTLQADETSPVIHAIGFGLGKRCDELADQPYIDLVGAVEINEWKGRKSVQILVKDISLL